MINYRYSIFETNSSSTHSLYFATPQEYNDFTAGKTVIFIEDGTFVPWEEAVQFVIDDSKEHDYKDLENDEGNSVSFEEFKTLSKDEQCYWLRDYDYRAYDDMGNYLQYYHDFYTTEHGDTVHVFGEYGNDW